MDKLTELTIEALEALAAEKQAAFEALRTVTTPEDSHVEQARALAADLDAIVAEQNRRTAAADEFASIMSRSFASVKGDEDDPTEGDQPVEGDEPVEGNEPVEGDEPAEPEATAEATEGAATATAKAPKAASRVATLARQTSRPVVPAGPKRHASGAGPVSITASAGAPNLTAGQSVSMLEVGQSILDQTRSFGTPNGTGETEDIRRFPTAHFGIDFPEELVYDESVHANAEDMIKVATDESRLPGGSLVASAGWCAPSETVYDLDIDATSEGMLSLPEVGVRRGGMRFANQTDFAAFYANPGFTQTEAQAIAGTTKPCVEVPCPTFTDVRMDVEGLCIKVPILLNAGYPEQVANFTAGTLIAHDHWMNSIKIGRVVAALGAARVITGLGSTVSDTIEAMGLVIDQRRQKHRLALDATMEVLVPFWVRNLFKADLARRNGRASAAAVTNAEVDAWFASQNANVQYLADWQLLNETANAYPATFQMAIYPAGTFVLGTQPVINLGTIYDAASLSVNIYTGLFTEQGFLVAKKKLGGDLLTLPVCNAGRMGALNITCGA